MCSEKKLSFKSESCQQQTFDQQTPKAIMRSRSFSLGEFDNSYNKQICQIQETETKWSKGEGRPCYRRPISVNVLAATRGHLDSWNCDETNDTSSPSSPYGLPCEENVLPILQTVMSENLDCFFRIIVLPILLVVFLAYSFTYLPAPPKAEIYRSISATFVILLGITLQSCFVTGWAARTLGFNDFLLLLRLSITNVAS